MNVEHVLLALVAGIWLIWVATWVAAARDVPKTQETWVPPCF